MNKLNVVLEMTLKLLRRQSSLLHMMRRRGVFHERLWVHGLQRWQWQWLPDHLNALAKVRVWLLLLHEPRNCIKASMCVGLWHHETFLLHAYVHLVMHLFPR